MDENKKTDLSGSFLLRATQELFRGTSMEGSADEVQDTLEHLLPSSVDGQTLDATAILSAQQALNLSEQRRAAQRQAEQQATAPTLSLTEIEHPDGTLVGLRVIVSSPDAAVRPTEDGFKVVADGLVETVDTTFTVSEVDYQDQEGITEVVVHAAPALEAGDDPDDDSDQ